MLRWHTLRCLGWRVSLRLCQCRCTTMPVARLRLEQLLCPPGNGRTEAMLAEVVRRLLIVAAVAVPVDDVVGRAAIGLAGNLRGAIGQQFHITSKGHLFGPVDAAVALRRFG